MIYKPKVKKTDGKSASKISRAAADRAATDDDDDDDDDVNDDDDDQIDEFQEFWDQIHGKLLFIVAHFVYD